jgi:hypothetical protein
MGLSVYFLNGVQGGIGYVQPTLLDKNLVASRAESGDTRADAMTREIDFRQRLVRLLNHEKFIGSDTHLRMKSEAQET